MKNAEVNRLTLSSFFPMKRMFSFFSQIWIKSFQNLNETEGKLVNNINQSSSVMAPFLDRSNYSLSFPSFSSFTIFRATPSRFTWLILLKKEKHRPTLIHPFILFDVHVIPIKEYAQNIKIPVPTFSQN